MMLILAALALISLIQGCKNAIQYSQDFQWDAAKVLTLRMNPYDLSLNPTDELKALGYEEYYLQMEANQFPSLLWILYPYTLLPPLAARYAWLISNLIFTAVLAWLFYRLFFKPWLRDEFIIVTLAMISGMPWRNHIGVGQHTIFALTFFLLSVTLCKSAKDNTGGRKWLLFFLSAFCLAVSFFKYTLTAPLALYYVYKRRYDILALAVLPHVLLTAFSAVWLNDSFINMIKKPLEVASWLAGGGSLDIGAVIGSISPSLASKSVLLTGVFMVLLFVYVLMIPAGFDRELLTVLTLWSMVITYHRIYDYFVLALCAPGVWLIASALIRKGQTDAPKDKKDGPADGDLISRVLKSPDMILYLAALLVIFYLIRVFHEAVFIMVAAGVLYYALTILITVGLWSQLHFSKRSGEKLMDIRQIEKE